MFSLIKAFENFLSATDALALAEHYTPRQEDH